MHLKQCLSKQDAVSLLELIHAATLCASEQDFRDIMTKLKLLMPHDYAIAAVAQSDGDHRIKSYDAINISYPSEWLSLYVQGNEHLGDPTLQANFSSFRVMYLADILKKWKNPNEFLSVTYDFGIKTGYVNGVANFSKAKGSMFCFTGRRVDRARRTEVILDLITPHLHQALLRVLNQNHHSSSLSPKELEVLKWLKSGKSTWDISVILGISERTVKFHVSNIMQKLDASSRTHAVAIALEQGLVAIE